MLAVTAGQPVVFLRKRHRLPIAALTAAQQYLSEGGELGTQERLRARPPGDRRASEHPRPCGPAISKVLGQVTGAECKEAAEELALYLDAGLPALRQPRAAFLNDLNDECLVRWGPR